MKYEDEIFGSAAQYACALLKSYRRLKVGSYQAATASAAVLLYKDAFERSNSLNSEKDRAALALTDLLTFFGRTKFDRDGKNVGIPMVARP